MSDGVKWVLVAGMLVLLAFLVPAPAMMEAAVCLEGGLLL